MANEDPYYVVPPKVEALPILISSPHSGTEIPSDIAARLRPSIVEAPEDTDWFIHQLYAFAPDIGITLLHARYSRYVIDLNRDPESRPLYEDARKESGLVPTQTFLGEPLYRDALPDAVEIQKRLHTYYLPYHEKVAELLGEMQSRHKHVLLFDAHSIRRRVATIRSEPFSDLILGDQNGRTADPALIKTALSALRTGSFNVAHNEPFKGGYLTRHFGKPTGGVHALQLEMAQDLYMDGGKVTFEHTKAEQVRTVLKNCLLNLSLDLVKLR